MAATYLPQLQHDKAPCMEKSDRGFTKQIKLNVNTKNSLYYDISLRERETHTQMKQKFKSSTLSCLVMFLENEKVFFFLFLSWQVIQVHVCDSRLLEYIW